MDYLSAGEAAKKWNISLRRVHRLCEDGRIEGIQRFGRSWMIPKDAEKPADARIKSGKYQKRKAAEGRDYNETEQSK